MKFQVEKILENPPSLMRRAGYIFQYEKEPARNATHSAAGGGEMSFVRVLARSGFPRFHSYIRMENGNLVGSLHLDQKKETYGKSTRHHGEYENEGVLKEEIERMREVLGNLTVLA